MADPLSITGLAIAVVQGGFQLYAGLSEYLDAVDARSEELDFARRQAMDMRRSLEIIEQLAPKLVSRHAASSSSLESFLRSCEVDIKALNDLLLELTEPGPSGEGLRHRLHRVQKAIQLSFHMTFGAGGWSVSPGISYVPLVDSESAPAFRLMDIHMNRLDKHNKDIETLALISVKKLISNGVPAMAHDHRGQSSAFLYLRGLDYGDLGPLLATSLISAEPDGTLFSKRRGIAYSSETTKMAVFPRWPVLAEVAGYGQLCSATASGNHAAVAMILATKSSALQERSIFGQSPLHLAAHQPSCLRLLINAIGGDKSLLNVLDAGSKSPLDYVMNDREPKSLESLKPLLEADCAIWQSNWSINIVGSYKKWELCIEAMKNRRERLKHLAIKVFDDIEIETHGLEGETVLDGKAAVVWRLLLDKGITVPQSLSPVRRYFERQNHTMYHQVKSVRELEKLWMLNFRDINMLDDGGMPPLMNWRLDVFDRGYETRCECLVAEFEEKSLEDRDGEPLWRADPAEFWVEVWASRMNGVIEGLDGANLTSEEIRAAENIGVEWKSPKPERPPSTKRPRHSLTFEEFEEEVDSIMRECR
ncbi:hypothetical protein E8E14_000389 [Neopestalotiopsis sp. 37M]|nr:hypothetical protein E8E14_000389 [Neopestalotiopsis sp. 37M]